jgi:hypothetical protein
MKTEHEEFLRKLVNLLEEHNAELSGAYDGDVNLYIDNAFVGYWSGDVTLEDFKG